MYPILNDSYEFIASENLTQYKLQQFKQLRVVWFFIFELNFFVRMLYLNYDFKILWAIKIW